MANEFKHASVGTELTQAEYEGTASHVLDSQAAGDIIYASSTSQLSRLGIGTAGKILQVNSGASAPEWTAALTGVTSIHATDLIIGEDSQTAIDFGTPNEIDFKVDNANRLTLTTGALYPETDNQIDLGTSSLEFKDAYFDGTVTSDAFAGPLTGDVTGTATNATHVTVADNESTDENNLIPFIEDTSATGNVGLESDGDFHYNPSSGTVTATTFVGNLTGTASLATTVTITDNESTNEDNAIIFTAGGDVDGGNLGLESDGTLTYNPSTGKITATGFIGALTGDVTGDVTGNADTATALATARTIGGVSFNGTANINLPGVNTAGNQNTSGTAAVATTVTITDNESTNEDNAIVFTSGGDVDGGNIGLESDGTLTYNPSTGSITATGFIGALTGNASTATALATARAINGVNFDGTGAITVPAAGSTLSDTVPVSKGGTNATSLADKAVLITQDSGTDTVAAAAMSTNGQLLIGGTDGPAVTTLTAGTNMTVTNGNGSITLAAASGGIEKAVIYRLTSSFTGDADPISSNLAKDNTRGDSTLGDSLVLNESSGVFDFAGPSSNGPGTGTYLIQAHALFGNGAADPETNLMIEVATDGSTFEQASTSQGSVYNSSARSVLTASYIFQVTNTSNDKVQFKISGNSGSNTIFGDSNINYTYFTFIKLA